MQFQARLENVYIPDEDYNNNSEDDVIPTVATNVEVTENPVENAEEDEESVTEDLSGIQIQSRDTDIDIVSELKQKVSPFSSINS